MFNFVDPGAPSLRDDRSLDQSRRLAADRRRLCRSRDPLLITLSVGCRDSGQIVFCDPKRQSGVDHGKTQEAISKGPKEERVESTP
jgi:hypothetical protein